MFFILEIPFMQIFSQHSVIFNATCYARRISVNDFPTSGAFSIQFY